MMVGTCANSPQPTTSPMLTPSSRREDARLHIAIEIERPGSALTADAGAAVAAERLPQVAHEEAIVPDQARVDPGRNPLGPLLAAGHDHAGQTVLGVVGHGDRLLLAREGLQAEHGAEDLLA